jgi:signal peptidase I
MKRVHSQPTRVALTAATLVLIVAWAVVLRPQFLGGPAAYVIVSGESMEPTLADGDFVFAKRQSSYRVGDVVVYRVPKGDLGAGALVIHRIVGGSAGASYLTKGDNREGRDLWRPRAQDAVGSVSLTVPGAGRVFAFLRTPSVWRASLAWRRSCSCPRDAGESGASDARRMAYPSEPSDVDERCLGGRRA